MHGIYKYIPETNNVSRVYKFAASPWSQFMLHVMLFPTFNVLNFVSTFWIIIVIVIIIKVKVKFTLEQSTKVQRESTGTALLFL